VFTAAVLVVVSQFFSGFNGQMATMVMITMVCADWVQFLTFFDRLHLILSELIVLTGAMTLRVVFTVCQFFMNDFQSSSIANWLPLIVHP
jgi:hypothetical protein